MAPKRQAKLADAVPPIEYGLLSSKETNPGCVPLTVIAPFSSPNGSVKFTGSFETYAYRLRSPPAKPMGSVCRKRPSVGA